MPSAYDIPGQLLVEKLAKVLFKDYNNKIRPPKWAYFVKTKPSNERPPDFPPDKDYNEGPGWWYYRAASILRQVYLHGPIGVSRLRTKYGGVRKRGMEPGRFKKGYAKIIRVILQQLEEAGLVKKELEGKKKGRVVTDKGRSLIDKIATEIYEDLRKNVPSLSDYISTLTE